MRAEVWDDTVCALGEGPLWHPLRAQLIWFDILGRRLLTREGGRTRTVAFDEHVSAAGWVDETHLLVATETRLMRLDLDGGGREDVCALDADDPGTRSNDGRADPWGGFWIGTMGKRAEPGRGAIWRWYRGDLRRLHGAVTVPNAICFPPGGACAYWADTDTGTIHRQPLAAEDGWPSGPPEPFLDLTAERLAPDGAVVDAEGNLWNAQWGAGRVACYAPDGRFLRSVAVGARQSSCPAFGGPDLTTLFCTSAADGIADDIRAAEPDQGRTFAAEGVARGQAEHRVIL